MIIKKNLMDAFEEFLNTPEPEPDIDNEYFEIEEQYKEMFGHPVPRAMLPDCLSTNLIKEAMMTCIQSNEDKLFDLLNIELSDEALY